jgi:hypothetical protein
MSGHGVHVHGAHDHAVEHEAHKTSLGQQVAIFSAILATIGAVVSMMSGSTQNEALYYKNHAVLKKAEASDNWAYYQAKGVKQNIAEVAALTVSDPAKVDFYKKEAARYAAEKKDIEAKARALDKESDDASVRSEKALHPHERLAVSITLLQIAIALASITVLAQKRWLLAGGAVAALAGAGFGIAAWF